MKIQLTPEDMTAGLPIDDGWYKAEVVEAISASSKDKGSVNHIATFKLENYKTADTTTKVYFNSKAMSFSLFRPFVAAAAGQTLAQFIEANKAGIDFEFESVKGQKVQLQIKNKLKDSGTGYISEVVAFVPYNYTVPF